MAKNSGIRALKNLKNITSRKDSPVKTQRVVFPKRSKEDAKAPAAVKICGPEEQPLSVSDDFLEETPVPFRAEKTRTKRFEKEDSYNEFADEPSPSFRSTRSSKNKRKDVFSQFFGLVFSIFSKPQSETSKTDAALAFASNNKRLGKKGRRNRAIFVYAGTGVAVVAVLLIVFLAPWGAAAPAEAEVTNGNKAALVDAQNTPGASQSPTATPGTSLTPSVSPTSTLPAVVVNGVDIPPTETPEQVSTTPPEETTTPVPTTEPDPTPVPVDVNDLTDFFVVDANAYYNEMGYSNNHYEYTENEYYMLAQIIDIEARGESFDGKVAVGNVVMNRVLCRTFPGSTITAVITRPGQFAYAGREDRKPSSSSKRAARAVLDDELWVIPQDVYYFRSGAPAGENWGSHKFYKKIGGHCFYRHSYSGRHRGGDAPPALFERTFKYAQYGCKPEKRVYRVQYMLNKLGYDVKADSYFGQGTKIELMKFQDKKGLEADGVAGPSTVKALIKEFGVDKYYDRFVS